LIRIGQAVADVFGRNVPADADAAFAVQPAFALAFAARVLKHGLAPRSVAVAEDAVRNQLLEARILLHFAPQPQARIGRTEQFVEVTIDVAGQKALKVAQPMKQRGRHDQNSFGMDFRHGCASFQSRATGKGTTASV